jgi:hypothetical protein
VVEGEPTREGAEEGEEGEGELDLLMEVGEGPACLCREEEAAEEPCPTFSRTASRKVVEQRELATRIMNMVIR